MALLDDIRKALGKTPKPQAGAQAAAAQAVADVARASTGRAGPTVQVQQPGLQAAQQAAKDQAAQVAQQGAVQAAQLAGAEQQVQAEAQLGQQRLATQADQAHKDLQAQVQTAGAQRGLGQAQFTAQQEAQRAAFSRELASKNQIQLNRLATDRGITVDQLFEEHRQGVQELAYRKDAAALEQKAHVLAMADREYVRNLTQVGDMRRLQSDLAWKAEVQRLTLGDKLDALLRGQGADALLNASQREFDEYLSRLDADVALAIVQQGARDATMGAGVKAAGTVAGGVADNWPKPSSNTNTTTTTAATSQAPASYGTGSGSPSHPSYNVQTSPGAASGPANVKGGV